MRVASLSLPFALTLVGRAVAYPHNQPALRSDDSSRAHAVVEAFNHAWKGYREYAWGHDELLPVTNGYGNSRNGWGASAVDALSTAIMMRNAEVVNQILDYIPTIDYSKTNQMVSLFETTIRYLGGMLSGYDLLKGPASDLVEDESKVDALLTQSRNLADILKFTFDTPTGIPHNSINITSKEHNGATTNGLAVTGTLVLEWTHLSDLTGDDEYAKLAQKAESYLLHPEPSWAEPFPGLVGGSIDISTGKFTDNRISWNGGDDSFYEYMMKMYVYDPTRFGLNKDRWVVAAESAMKYLASQPSSRPDLTFLGTYNNGTFGYNSQHLTCFDGGSFLLGGRVLDRKDFRDFGLELVKGCHAAYVETITNIGPESFSWDAKSVPESQKAFFERAGFYITNGAYILRPEVVESFYYAWRITGEDKYREWIWNAFVAVRETCRTDSGFSGLTHVNAKHGGSRINDQESFFFAELMKYAYLAFSPGKSSNRDAQRRLTRTDAPWQIRADGQDEFVYNTEAHPFRVVR